MRILHTSDWHLGGEFHKWHRHHEFSAFLSWLEDQLEEHAVDALIIAGDVFDTQNPPITALNQFYRFISQAKCRLPKLNTVIIGGNHDSAGRLEAPSPILDAFGVRVVGSLPRTDGKINIDRILVPLHDRYGQPTIICAAIPFLRPPDLPPATDETIADSLIWGVRQIYDEILTTAAERLTTGQALITTGHCYMVGSEITELSERRILGGNEHPLPVDIFSDDLAYVALGHMHRAQKVGRDTIRYCGSPIPMSVTERDYRHQVLLIDIDGGATKITQLFVPRPVDVLRVPAKGRATAAEIMPMLHALSTNNSLPVEQRPYLDVVVTDVFPQPSLQRDIEEAIRDRGVRLIRIKTIPLDAPDATETQDTAPRTLEECQPEDVFKLAFQREYDTTPGDDYLAAFRELVEQVQTQDEVSA